MLLTRIFIVVSERKFFWCQDCLQIVNLLMIQHRQLPGCMYLHQGTYCSTCSSSSCFVDYFTAAVSFNIWLHLITWWCTCHYCLYNINQHLCVFTDSKSSWVGIWFRWVTGLLMVLNCCHLCKCIIIHKFSCLALCILIIIFEGHLFVSLQRTVACFIGVIFIEYLICMRSTPCLKKNSANLFFALCLSNVNQF